MNTPLKVCFLLLGAVLLPSCALQDQFKVGFQTLHPGHTYEVRKAVGAGDTFQPQLMTSYFFMVESPRPPSPPRPPLLAAARGHAPAVVSVRGEQVSNVRSTAYCHNEADHLRYGHDDDHERGRGHGQYSH